MAQCSAVIFDLDGTLLDTELHYYRAGQKVLARYGIDYGMEEHRLLLKNNTRIGAARLLAGSALSVEEFIRERSELVAQGHGEIPELPGVTGFLNALADRGVPLGLVSNASRDGSTKRLATRAWRDYFAVKVFGDDSRVRNIKPAPDMYVACAGELDVKPEECVVFEDSPVGVTSALNAGMYVFAVKSPYVEQQDLQDVQLVDGFEDLAGLLRRCGLGQEGEAW